MWEDRRIIFFFERKTSKWKILDIFSAKSSSVITSTSKIESFGRFGVDRRIFRGGGLL